MYATVVFCWSFLRTTAKSRGSATNLWRLWLRAAGATEIDWPAGPILPDSRAVIEAAIAGQGLALARRSMVKELQSGKLASPVPARLKIDLA